MTVVGSLCQDNLNLRLEKIASELGIDLDKETWNFDQRTMEFVKVEPKEVASGEQTFHGEPEANSPDVPVGEPSKADAVDSEKNEG